MLLVTVAAVSAFDYSDFAQQQETDVLVLAPVVDSHSFDTGAFLRVRRAPQHHGHGGALLY